MTEIILHHYPLSPHSEKIRLLFGLKGLSWRSVEVPAMTPRPKLSPMTGAFRRIPILQIGADIYCDTLLIADKINQLKPSPAIYPVGADGIVKALSRWIEQNTFVNAVCLTLSGMAGRAPTDLIAERQPFFGIDLDPARLRVERAKYLQRVNAHAFWLEQTLADGREYLFGEDPSVADLAAYHPIWFARQNGGPEIEAVLPPLATSPWYDRISALGHGNPSAMPPEKALEIAAAATPVDCNDWSIDARSLGVSRGDQVRVLANDYGKDSIIGHLLALSGEEIVIRRENPDVGVVNLHFPRVGFDFERQ